MHPLNQLLAKSRPGELPDPGLHQVSRETYFTWPCLNASSLKAAKSPAHFLAALTRPAENRDCLRFGSFAHCGNLEPMELLARYVVMPDLTEGIDAKVPKATNEYKDRRKKWEAEHAGREVVTQDWLDKLSAMVARLREHERAFHLLHAFGKVEAALVWDDPETGVRCKALCDHLDVKAESGKRKAESSGRITDYKTTRRIDRFEADIGDYGYDLQGAFYVDGAEAVFGAPFCFHLVAQENESPYSVRAAPLSDFALYVGRRTYRESLSRLVAAAMQDTWPALDDPDAWELPPWKAPPLELCIQGELVTL